VAPHAPVRGGCPLRRLSPGYAESEGEFLTGPSAFLKKVRECRFGAGAPPWKVHEPDGKGVKRAREGRASVRKAHLRLALGVPSASPIGESVTETLGKGRKRGQSARRTPRLPILAPDPVRGIGERANGMRRFDVLPHGFAREMRHSTRRIPFSRAVAPRSARRRPETTKAARGCAGAMVVSARGVPHSLKKRALEHCASSFDAKDPVHNAVTQLLERRTTRERARGAAIEVSLRMEGLRVSSNAPSAPGPSPRRPIRQRLGQGSNRQDEHPRKMTLQAP